MTPYPYTLDTPHPRHQVRSISEEMGIGFLGAGFDPKWSFEDVPRMPKQRYKIMREYMPTRGSLGTDMMFRSCTIQVSTQSSWQGMQVVVVEV